MVFKRGIITLSVPAGLDILQTVEDAAVAGVTIHADEVAWLCNSLYRSYDLSDGEDLFFPLHSMILRKYLGKSSATKMNFLVQSVGLLICNGSYRPSSSSKRYSFSPFFWNSEVATWKMSKGSSIYKRVVKDINEWHRIGNKAVLKHLNHNLKKDLSIDFKASRQVAFTNFVAEFRPTLKIKDDRKTEMRLNKASARRRYYERIIQQYEQGLGDIMRDSRSTYRVYSTITSTPKGLRQFIRYHGEIPVQVDLKSSQLMLLLHFLDPVNLSRKAMTSRLGKELWADLEIAQRKYLKPLNQIRKRLATDVANNEIERFRTVLLSGDIYTTIGAEMAKHNSKLASLSPAELRGRAKKQLLSALFDNTTQKHHYKPGQAWRAFKDLFPTIAATCSFLKRYVHADLSYLLQRLEAIIMIDNVCRRLQEEFSYVPILTLHDCIVTIPGRYKKSLSSYADIVKRVIEEEVFKIVGVIPRTTIESWGEEQLKEVRKAA